MKFLSKYIKKRKRRKGFTLIELLVVIAILGVLSSIVLSALGETRAKTRDAKRLAEADSIAKALELYWDDHGAYPIIQAYSDRPEDWNVLKEQLSDYINLPVDPQNELNGFFYHYVGCDPSIPGLHQCPLPEGSAYELVIPLETGDPSECINHITHMSQIDPLFNTFGGYCVWDVNWYNHDVDLHMLAEYR